MSAAMLIGLPWEQYTQGGYLGSSAFAAWGKCSLESWSAQFLESSYASSGSKFTAGGSAIDMRLTGDLSGKKLAIKPEGMSFSTKDGKAWRDEHSDCEIITAEQDAEVNAALPMVREAIAVMGSVYGSSPIYQVTFRGEVSGLKIQTRPDIMIGTHFPDLKYVNPNAFDGFVKTFSDSRYFLQAGLAFGLGLDSGIDDPTASFILAESGTVHPRCEVYNIPRRYLQAGWDRIRRIADEIAAVQDSEHGFITPVKFLELECPGWAERRMGL